ncbi:MAG: hypothetical protein U5K38_06900 [Woeseiaceae bacterium]|nr:hypothetical protein [Woeseiaceae bacterium]
MPFEDHLRRAVLEPLHKLGPMPEPRVMARLVTGYDSDRRSEIPYGT